MVFATLLYGSVLFCALGLRFCGRDSGGAVNRTTECRRRRVAVSGLASTGAAEGSEFSFEYTESELERGQRKMYQMASLKYTCAGKRKEIWMRKRRQLGGILLE